MNYLTPLAAKAEMRAAATPTIGFRPRNSQGDVGPVVSSAARWAVGQTTPGVSTISGIVMSGPIVSSNTEGLTTVVRAAGLTRDPELAQDEPVEAEPRRPGRAARAVVSDGRAVRDAI